MVFNIWRLTDGKAGHDSQSIGLCKAIEKLNNGKHFDITVKSSIPNFKNYLFQQFPAGNNLPDPDIIIGAGHRTHMPMLTAKHARGGKIIVLMKPSLPLSFFDACLIPEHDHVHQKKNVITTYGAINPIEFNKNKSNNTGLILIGGPSKHYKWNDNMIVDQIKQITSFSSNINWIIADSPRTPETMLSRITGLSNVSVLRYKMTSSDKIREIIFKTGNIWVSKDSISMIYESLSSGAAVGLLDVEEKKTNKISQGVNDLINKKQLTSFMTWKITNKLLIPSIRFNEADRCAAILNEKGLLT